MINLTLADRVVLRSGMHTMQHHHTKMGFVCHRSVLSQRSRKTHIILYNKDILLKTVYSGCDNHSNHIKAVGMSCQFIS